MICVRVTTAPISTHTLRKEGDVSTAICQPRLFAISPHTLRKEGDKK